MDKFSLDDVRDSFSADISAQIRALGGAARTLSESPGLEWRPEKDGHPEFGAIARACHTIYGTCSLVEVKSLYESARLLHIVGNLGEECMRTIDEQLKLVRALVVIARHGAGSLDRMLALELEHRGDEAWEEALRLREELSRWDDARRELEARREREEHDERAAEEVHRTRRDSSQTQEFDAAMKDAATLPPPAPPAPATSPAAGEFDFAQEIERERGEMRAPWPPSAAFGAAPPAPPPAEPRAEEFSFDEAEAHEAEAARAPEPAAPAPAPPSEFSFDSMVVDVPKEAASVPREYSFEEGDAPSGELREFFQQEAREYLVALQGYLQALARDPADVASATSLERIYHTLKGTAATVGLGQVSAQASDLQDTMEEALAKGQPLGPAFLAQLVERTNRLLAAGGLPQVGVEAEAAAPAGEMRSPELRKLFWEDAAQVLIEMEEALARLGTTADGAGEMDTLCGLFHRLKGSAVVASELAMAETAGRLQDLCENGTALLHPQELRRGLDQLQRLLEPGHTPLPAETAPLREAVPTDVDPVIWEAFEIESGELLESIDRAIFALENSQTPKAEISALFRHYHTLKGSVNTVGLAGLGRLVHKLEDLLEDLQEAPILPPLANLATLLLNVQDEVRRNLRHAKRGFIEVHVSRLDSEIQRLRGGGRPAPLARTGDSSSPFSSGVSGRSDSGTGRSAREALADTGAFDRKFVRVSTERLDGLMNLTGELVVSRSRLARRVFALQTMHRELTLGRNRLIRAVDRFREQHEFESVTRGRAASAAARRAVAGPGTAVAEFGELELDRYGDVNILARTLADIGHGISQVQGRMNDSLSAFSEDAAGFGAIVTGLQTEITQARMVPVEQLFMRLRLPVRDAGEREGKGVRVQTRGEDVDLDKAIIDELYTPLLHLVRNAVAHGIEKPDVRRTAGKEPVGSITLAARQEAGELLLDVQDDGAGLDLPRLRELGVQRGLLPPGIPADDAAVGDVVFHAGVSTRADVDDVSGRGVGLDVVRREIERLGGSVRVTTLRGLGTTFTIHLPLTLAITRALLLRHRGLAYAVPLNLAERILDLQESNVHDSAGQRRINIDGVYHTLRSLDVLLGLPARSEADGAPKAAVLLRVGQSRLAVEVDRVIGQEEIVVKGLGDVLTGHPLFSGVTVSGDGELILIFDVVGLFHKDRRAGDAAAAPAPSLGRSRVLFIDDSLSVRKVAERFLAALGAEVVLAADGQEGLDQLRAPGRFDLVFTDLEMPRLHGYELIREVRAHAALRDLPVIVVTSRSGQKHRDQAAAVGATDYITKPFSQELLGRMIRKWAKPAGHA